MKKLHLLKILSGIIIATAFSINSYPEIQVSIVSSSSNGHDGCPTCTDDKAWDGNINTYWVSLSSGVSIIQFNIASPSVICKVEFNWYWFMVQSITMQGLNDGVVKWTKIIDYANYNSPQIITGTEPVNSVKIFGEMFSDVAIAEIRLYRPSMDIVYTYDAAGNRIHRELSLLKSVPVDSNELAGLHNPDKPAEPIKYTDMIGSREVNIYPNPTEGLLTIEVIETGPSTSAPFEISVYDLQGKTVFNQSDITRTTVVDLHEQPAGSYVLRMKEGDKLSEWKIIKE
jgi:hypothetical protein